jgi:ectoine hydroxylase-related dioxygenase (phytanoyl-CoA dioxygenase family)
MLDDAQEEPLFTRSGTIMTKAVEAQVDAARRRVLAEIARLDLWQAAVELDVNGYTVISAEKVGPPEFAAALRDALLDVSAEDSGVTPDAEGGSTHVNTLSRHGQVELIEPLVHRRRIFQEALVNEAAMALVTYMLGESCGLIANSGQIKGPGKHYLPLHSDAGLTFGAGPFPITPHTCNAVWVLSDYNAENGATCMVAGSHKLCRHPTEAEVRDMSYYQPLEIKAGSILVWHGNTWHAAVPRNAPGLRLGIIQYFGRANHNKGRYRQLFTEEQIASLPPRFNRVIGNPGQTLEDAAPAALFSQYG